MNNAVEQQTEQQPEPYVENALETSLRLAADDPAQREVFYQLLMNSTVFVLASADVKEGQDILAPGQNIEFQTWEKSDGSGSAIPFFTSLEVLEDCGEGEEPYLALPAQALFEITQGAMLVLNPKSPFGKEFLPDEVQELLTSGAVHLPTQRTITQETEVLLGQPSVYPSEMVAAVNAVLAQHPKVSRAFLALMHDQSIDENPNLVIGIESVDDIEKLAPQLGQAASGTLPAGLALDIMRITQDEKGVSDYLLKQTTPFYERKIESKSALNDKSNFEPKRGFFAKLRALLGL